MTEREKLIELMAQADERCFDTQNCRECVGYGKGGKCGTHLYVDHLLSNGVIVPPCKVGQTVWFADQADEAVFKGNLVSYCLDAAHFWFNCHYKSGLNIWHPIEDFGKTVFLTKEEAEKALKERSEGK